jgi:hypothetical protein
MLYTVQLSRKRLITIHVGRAMFVAIGDPVLIIMPRFDPVLSGRHVKAARASFSSPYQRA